MLNSELDNILLDNVVRLSFVKKTDGSIRTMLCTKAYDLLNSAEGANMLGYHQPSGSSRYNVNEANNVIVWDIERRDYRTVSCDTVKILNVVPQEKYLARLRLND